MNEDIFIHEEIKNDELLRLMHEMRQERTSEKMLEVLKLAAASTFIVPVDSSPDGRFSFHAVGDNKGRRFAVAYSDTGSFTTSEQQEDQKGVKASFEDLMELVLQDKLKLDGVIINPGASEVIFGKELINSIKEQMTGTDTVNMRVAEPSEYPAGIKELISSYCKDEPSVDKVYMRLLTTEDAKNMKWLFGIDTKLTGESRQYLFDTFKHFITPHLQNIEPIVASVEEDFVKQAVKDSKAFYERS